MSNKKRIMIIISLLLIGLLILGVEKDYEKRLIKNKELKEVSVYEPFKKVNFFKPQNRERYLRYYEENKDLTYESIVIRVNIGLDYGFYNYIKDANIKKENLVLVNKYLRLKESYKPDDLVKIDNKYFINGNKSVNILRKDAKEAFERLSKDSIKNNTPVYGQSGYRSFDRQKEIYEDSLQNKSKEETDKEIARPGHSEHQTGLAIDVSSSKNGNMLVFDKTGSYKWMQENCYKYGFIMRYPKSKENIHGFIYEPWHYRYVGTKLSKKIMESNLTYDEYYYKFIEK